MSPADHFSYVPVNANVAEPTLTDNYEYVMYGRVFDMTYKKDGTVVVGCFCEGTGSASRLGIVGVVLQ